MGVPYPALMAEGDGCEMKCRMLSCCIKALCFVFTSNLSYILSQHEGVYDFPDTGSCLRHFYHRLFCLANGITEAKRV